MRFMLPVLAVMTAAAVTAKVQAASPAAEAEAR